MGKCIADCFYAVTPECCKFSCFIYNLIWLHKCPSLICLLCFASDIELTLSVVLFDQWVKKFIPEVFLERSTISFSEFLFHCILMFVWFCRVPSWMWNMQYWESLWKMRRAFQEGWRKVQAWVLTVILKKIPNSFFHILAFHHRKPNSSANA